jgi:hypothetical protein
MANSFSIIFVSDFSTKINRVKNKNKFTFVIEIIIKYIILIMKINKNIIILIHFRSD